MALYHDDLDPFGDGSLTQSWTFDNASPASNLQGTNAFTTDWPPTTLKTTGLLGNYPEWTTRTAGYYEPQTSGGHGIVGDTACSFTIFFKTSYYEGLNFSFGGDTARYNVEIYKSMGPYVSQNVFVTLHKNAVSLDCGPVSDGWHSVQYTYDGAGTSAVYLDGVFKGNLSLTMKFINNPLHGFCYYSATADYRSNWDQVCVWNRKLTASECLQVSQTEIFQQINAQVDATTPSLQITALDPTVEVNSVQIDTEQNSRTVTAHDPIVIDDSYGAKVTDESLDPFGDGSLEQSFTFNGGKLENEQATNEFISPINGTIVSSPSQFGDGIRNAWNEKDTTLNGHGQSGNHSFSFWAYCNAYTHFTFGGEGNAGNVEFIVWASQTDQCSIFLKINNRAYESVALSRACITGQMNLFTYTYSGGTNKLYINNTLVYTVGVSNSVVSTQPIEIRAYDFSGTQITYFDQIMVFNKTLALAEVQALYAMENSQSFGESVDLDYKQITLTAKNPTVEIIYPTNVTVDANTATLVTTALEVLFGGVTEVDADSANILITPHDPTITADWNSVFNANAINVQITPQDPTVDVPAINVTVNADQGVITATVLDPIIETRAIYSLIPTKFGILQEVELGNIRYNITIVQENEILKQQKIINRVRV